MARRPRNFASSSKTPVPTLNAPVSSFPEKSVQNGENIEEETDRRGGRNSFSSMPHYRFSTRMIWRKGRIEDQTLGRIMKNGWSFGSHHAHQTTTLLKWMFFQKTFLQMILAAKWLVRHSRMSPKWQRRPLPSHLSVSFPMGENNSFLFSTHFVPNAKGA